MEKERTTKRCPLLTQEEEENIIKLYQDGYLIKEICQKTGRSLPTVTKRIRNLIQEGKLKSREKVKTIPNEDGKVYCNIKTARNCIYGSYSANPNLCNYILINGKSRGCNFRSCDKFVQITEDRPRIKCSDEFNGVRADGSSIPLS